MADHRFVPLRVLPRGRVRPSPNELQVYGHGEIRFAQCGHCNVIRVTYDQETQNRSSVPMPVYLVRGMETLAEPECRAPSA